MKKKLTLIPCFLAWALTPYAQTNPSVTSTEVNNILLGNYTPATYQASAIINNPSIVSAGLLSNVSADTLTADLYALNAFYNRNMFSDTVSNTAGIGATRRWVYQRFQQYSAANQNRLRVSYLKFTYAPSTYGCTGDGSNSTQYNVMAVLPGSQTTNKSLIIIEAHMDSRNADNCDITGSAPGIGDNATGTALVMELARALSKYTFRSTIVFSINTGEEQGLIGAHALANYLQSQHVLIKAVNNNDVSGGVFCGHTSSAPSCPFYGNIDSTDLRIFSLGDINSPNKQWARYIKLEYKEQLSHLVTVPANINIMEPDDRTGRGGDHQAFTDNSYTAVRFTQANEDGNAGNNTGYSDRQHNVRDSLGHYNSTTGTIDSIYLNPDYLARNTIVNGNSLAMVALGPDSITMSGTLWTENTIKVSFTPTGSPGYRVAVRSATNDWDTVYTVTGANSAVLQIPYAGNTVFYVSAAAMDANGVESQFSTEYVLSTGLESLALAADTTRPAATTPDAYGIRLLPNRPNPFDESTMIAITSGTDIFADRTCLLFTTINGRSISRIPVHLQKGMNEVIFNHGYGAAGVIICSLLIDGLPAQSTKMIFRGN
jgi:Peptidase family M28